MTRRNKILHYSLFVGIVGSMGFGDAFSAVRIGNATRNNYYEQQMVEQQRVAAAQSKIASTNDIAYYSGSGSEVPASQDNENYQLEMCSQIYPGGMFEIARPTAGIGMGGAKTCTAIVELRGYQMGAGGADIVLARANVAAGSTVNCNISDFPESSYTLDAQNVIFPADIEPTVQDVKKVMDEEQKQNAGLKIAAAALIGGIGGNISGKNDAGKDGLFGTSKSKMTNTVIGAVGGAAIGAGGAYAGKVGGDMIMSAGINAAAGGIVGNIMAAGDSVLRIEKCKVGGKEESCLYGYLVTGPTLKSRTDGALCKDADKNIECYNYYIDLDDGETVMRCESDDTKCLSINNLISITVNKKSLEGLERKDLDALKDSNSYKLVDGENKSKTMVGGQGDNTSHTYRLIDSAKIDSGPKQPVLIADNISDSAFGRKSDYWWEWKKKPENQNAAIYYRNGDGNAGENLRDTDATITLDNFYPMYIDASDGGIVDLGNKARLKSTLIGAGAGGAIGAFVAYQGAQSDIDDRWVSAVREYKDSLQKFYCATGTRFLSYYNDVVFIPSVKD